MVSKIKKKIKPKLKIKKRRPKAAKSEKRQDAGEHQDPLIAPSPIIVVLPKPDKVLKLRWWTVINEELYYYYLGEHSNDEIRELASCLNSNSRFQSHKSFTSARKYLYTQAIMEVEKFAAVVKRIRTRRKAEYHVDR